MVRALLPLATMPRATSWRDLKLGLAALAVLVAGAAAVLRYARVGAMHGDTVRLYAATSHSRGLLPGSEVWLDGQKVGLVREVGFRAPSADTLNRTLLELEILADVMPQIRGDAGVDVRAGGSFIGSPVVWIDGGTVALRPVREGDTLIARPSREIESMRAELAGATAQVPAIFDNLRVLATQLRSARGTLGAIGIEGPKQIAATGALAGQLVERATQGQGTVGLFLRRGDATAHARHAMALADSVNRLLSSSSTSLGRLRRDSTLLRTVGAVQRDLQVVQAALVEPRGTAGRALHDSALVRQIARTRAEFDALAADLQRNPLRYLVF